MTTRPDLRPIFLDEDGCYVFEDGTRVPEQPISFRKALLGGFVTIALVIVIPLFVGFAAYRDVVADQIDKNEALIKQVNAERIARTQAINEFIYSQCVLGEVRDVVMVDHLRDDKREARATMPPGPELDARLSKLDDGINALEPDFEQDCEPPSAVKPKGTP